jgi:hypothetical protein
VANKGLTTLPTSSQSNTMETLVMNMATHVKFDAFRLKNAKDQVNTFLKKLDVTQDIFVELDFQVCGPKPNYVMCFKRP